MAETLDTLRRRLAGYDAWFKNNDKRLRELIGSVTDVTGVPRLEGMVTSMENAIGRQQEVCGTIQEMIFSQEKLDPKVADQMFCDQLAMLDLPYEGIARLKSKILDLKPVPVATTRATPSIVNVRHPEKPKIEPFDGDYLKWATFWDKFNLHYHAKADIAKIDKFQRLQELVVGKAASSIQITTLSSDNYDLAIKSLQRRFGRRMPRLAAHIGELLKIPSIQSLKSIGDLRSMVDAMVVHVGGLQALNVIPRDLDAVAAPPATPSSVASADATPSTEDSSTIIATILFFKLPEEFRTQWSRLNPGDELPLGKLLDFIQTEVETRERGEMCQGTIAVDQADVYKPQRIGARPTMSNMTCADRAYQFQQQQQRQPSSSSPSFPQTAPPCPFCQANHHPENCKMATSLTPTIISEAIQRSRRCRRCFHWNHFAKNCGRTLRCRTCKANHHYLLCPRRKLTKSGQDSNPQSGSTQSVNSAAVSTSSPPFSSPSSPNNETPSRSNTTVTTASAAGANRVDKEDFILAKTATVVAVGPSGEKGVRIFFDDGSHRSYVTSSLVSQLSLRKVAEENLTVHLFSGATMPAEKRSIYEVSLKDIDTGQSITIQAVEQKVITAASFPVINNLRRFPHLRNIKLADANGEDSVSLLIGLDHLWDIFTGETRRGSPGTPVAQDSLFGWVVSGPVPMDPDLITMQMSNSTTAITAASLVERHSDPIDEEGLFRLYFEGESVPSCESQEYGLEALQRSLNFTGERYEVRLPFLQHHPPLVDNYRQARARLCQLMEKLRKNPDLLRRYNEALEEMQSLGFTEDVHQNQVPSGRIFYMPHRPVVKEKSEFTKVRPVFDASAKGSNGVSLNDVLEAGPNLLPLIPSLLLQFRTYPVAFTADIRKAFMMISIHPEDRDFLRFLWMDEAGNLIIRRFCRVTFGAKSSPFLLNGTIRLHLLRLDDPKGVELADHFYVDDLIWGAENSLLACKNIAFADLHLSEAGMDLRQWTSNSTEVMEYLKNKGLHVKPEHETFVLGIKWNYIEDGLSISSIPVQDFGETRPTKREILSLLATIYDPLGLIMPISVRGKLLMQRTWTSNCGWDDMVDIELCSEFKVLISQLKTINEISFPRRMFDTPSALTASFHVFVDASPQACAAVAYVREEKDGKILVTLVAAKSKVAHAKEKLTLPRMELAACVLGTRLLGWCVKTVPILNEVPWFCWTDSMIALCWLKSSPDKWKQFVANRIRSIQEQTKPSQWNHIKGKDNPADLGTRPNGTMEHLSSELWLRGPSWLKLSMDQWPEDACPSSPPAEVMKEQLSKPVVVAVAAVDSSILHIEDYSSLEKVLRVTAYILRPFKRFKEGRIADVGVNSKESRVPAPVFIEEIEEAKKYWIRHTQQNLLSEEIKCIRNGQQSSLWQLGPVIGSDGILRSEGRTLRAEEGEALVLLPSRSKFGDLLIMKCHQEVFHGGVELTLTKLRSQYWIIKGRPQVKRVLADCRICRKFKASPYRQIESPLPAFRLKEESAFSTTGVDFAGPLYVKEGKAYILLMTCAKTRAVFLELVSNLSFESFHRAFRRFQSIFPVRRVYSDNGKTFVKASIHLSSKLDWMFIPDRSPWWGGMWESLVKRVKSLLMRILGRASLSMEELRTVLFEVASILNHRPITFMSDERNEPRPLKPIDFMRPVWKASSKDLPELLAQAEKLSQLFWKRWRTEYIATLRSWRVKEGKKNPGSYMPSIGDVVLVDPQVVGKKNRAMYPLGVVEDTIMGRDGNCRVVHVRTQGSVLRRPTKLIYPLEVKMSQDQNVVDDREEATEDEQPTAEVEHLGAEADGSLNVLEANKKRMRCRPRRLEDYVLY